MPYRDLREFIRATEKIGESRVVEGADWDLEIGTIAELNYERQGPALVFDRIKGYPKGYRVLANALDSIRRALLAVDLPVELDLDAALDAYDTKLASYRPVQPVEVVREEVTGLPIPATAEIVIAGTVPPPHVEARDEGPFGEWTGYYASGTRPEPVIRIEALYHRNDPIILGMPPVKHYKRPSHFGLPSGGKNEIEKLRRAGVEDVLDVWHLAVPGVTVVQIRQRYPGHAMKSALTLASGGHQQDRIFVAVDEDINPRDPEEVLWAIGTRCDPETSITVLKGCPSGPLNPRIPPEQKRRGDFTSSRAVLNACKPYEWLKEFPATNVASPELRRRVLEKWKELF